MGAQVSFDAFSSGGYLGQAWNHTVDPAATMLVLWVHYSGSCTATFNGVAMTRVLDNSNQMSLFYLYRPTSGTHQIALSVAATNSGACSFIGAGPSVSGWATAGAVGGDSSVTGAAKNERSLMMDGIDGGSAAASGPGAGQTRRSVDAGAAQTSTKPAPAEAWNTNVTMTWHLAFSTGYAAVIVSVDAPDEGGSIGMTPFLTH